MPSNYTSLEAELHDPFWAEEASPELEWLDALLKQYPGRSLEVGCGSGRLLLPLMEKGHQVEGLESSNDMLELCRQSARNSELEAILHQGDMDDFEPDQPYDAVLVPAFTLQLSKDPQRTLSHFRDLLTERGLLYLTIFIPFAEIEGELPEGEWYRDHELTLENGATATIDTRHRIDLDAQKLHRKHHYRVQSGERIQEHHSEQSIRWLTARQLSSALEGAGFTVENAVADFDETLPVDEESQIITVIARKTKQRSTS